MMIDHIVLDVDGTLTDGGIFISSDGVETKQFQSKDGLLVRVLPRLGFTTIFLTGRRSELTEIRAKDLQISVVIQGVKSKWATLGDYMKKHDLSGERFAYIGDDLNDCAAMKLCAFRACPADAAKEVRELCDYVSPFNGGHGAVRDICEKLLKEAGKWNEVINIFI